MVGHGRPRQQRGTNCGTAGYKAPEVSDLLAYSTEADIYSWGMCVYTIDSLVDEPPVDHATQKQVGMPTHSLCNVSYLSPYVASKGEGSWEGRTNGEWGRGGSPCTGAGPEAFRLPPAEAGRRRTSVGPRNLAPRPRGRPEETLASMGSRARPRGGRIYTIDGSAGLPTQPGHAQPCPLRGSAGLGRAPDPARPCPYASKPMPGSGPAD